MLKERHEHSTDPREDSTPEGTTDQGEQKDGDATAGSMTLYLPSEASSFSKRSGFTEEDTQRLVRATVDGAASIGHGADIKIYFQSGNITNSINNTVLDKPPARQQQGRFTWKAQQTQVQQVVAYDNPQAPAAPERFQQKGPGRYKGRFRGYKGGANRYNLYLGHEQRQESEQHQIHDYNRAQDHQGGQQMLHRAEQAATSHHEQQSHGHPSNPRGNVPDRDERSQGHPGYYTQDERWRN